jgi:kynureninase
MTLPHTPGSLSATRTNERPNVREVLTQWDGKPGEEQVWERAAECDAQDPLRGYRERFIGSGTGAGSGSGADSGDETVAAYLDGNSLGRPLKKTAERLQDFIVNGWGERLIRGWDEGWLDLPTTIGDRLGRVALGAGEGQTFIGDSTTVILYKLLEAAAADGAARGRREIVVDTDNFPTDRYVAEGIAARHGLALHWIEADPQSGVTPDQVREAVNPGTAVVLLSQVAYRSGFIADVPTITEIAHAKGALILWDLCHAVGVVPALLDQWGVDLAVGCTYKYLNGGPGAPAFGYVRAEHQQRLRQPIWGWMGHADSFAMGDGYQPRPGIGSFISGTPPVLGMIGIQDTLDLLEEVGLDAVRRKSIDQGEFALALVDELLVPLGVRLGSPREAALRGGHLTIRHERSREVTAALWRQDVIPDFRTPDGIRLGFSPLSTSYAEIARGILAIRDLLAGSIR